LRNAIAHQRVDVAVVEVATDLGRHDHFVADALERVADDLFCVSVAAHVGGVKEGASEIVRPAHGPFRFGVVGRAVGIAEGVAPDRPSAEPDLADLQAGAAEGAGVHASSWASASGEATGSEHVVPTQTVAAVAVAIFRMT